MSYYDPSKEKLSLFIWGSERVSWPLRQRQTRQRYTQIAGRGTPSQCRCQWILLFRTRLSFLISSRVIHQRKGTTQLCSLEPWILWTFHPPYRRLLSRGRKFVVDWVSVPFPSGNRNITPMTDSVQGGTTFCVSGRANSYYRYFVGESVIHSWQVLLTKSAITWQLTDIPMFVHGNKFRG